MKTVKVIRFFCLMWMALLTKTGLSQQSYYQDIFAGGVTGAGYSPDHFQSAPTVGSMTINIPAGSTIRQAYLIVGRLGNAPATTVNFAGSPLLFNAGNQVTPSFNTLYGGASGIHVINVSALITVGVNVYTLGLPAQSGTVNRYQDFYLYVSYNNPVLPSVATAIFLNNQNAANLMNWGTLTMINPFNTLAGDVCYSFFGGYECGNGDGEQPIINGTNLGIAWGQDINSGQCGGPVGSFYYNSGVMTALSDDNINQAVAGPEALSKINALVTNGSNTLTLSHQHQNAGGQDNHPWGGIFVWNSCLQPTITAIASPSSICAGASSTLTGSGAGVGGTYTWTPGNIVGGTITVTPTITTTYTVSGKNAAGCTGTQTVLLTVNPAPTVTAVSNPTAICIGQSATLTAAGASTYTWNPGNTSGTSITVSPAATTIYSVVGTSAAGCVNSKTVSLTVNPLPAVVAANTSPACVGGAFALNASAATTYTWSGPLVYTSNVQNPNVTNATAAMGGVYTVTVTDVNGCKNSATTNVVITPIPIIAPTNNGPYCAGASINLTASLAGTSYTWTGPGGAFLSNLQNPTVANGQVINTGVYSVTVASGAGCLSSGTTSVTVNALPTPVALSNAPVCEGQAINFTGSGGIIYNWSGPSFNSNAQNPGILVAGLPNNGVFTLTVTDANGCTNSTNLAVVVNALPVIGVVGSTVCAQQAINLGANGGTTYSWSGPGGYTSNQQNPNIPNSNPGMAGVYNVTVTNANGCVNTNFTNVIVNPLPTPNAFNNGPLCVNQLLNLSANGGLTYTWNGPGGFFATGQSPTVTANNTNMSGNYTVTATDNIGCTGTAVTLLNVNPLPNVSIVASTNKGCVPLCMTFTCATSPSATVNWSFGDGSGSGGINSSNCYKTEHDYTVNAGVTDANGCFNQNTYPVSVYPIPVADYNYSPIRPIENVDEVIFTDASHGATITSWNWYFTNNATNQSTLQNPQFIYTEAGTYNAVLVVKSDKGCTDTIIKTIFVGEDYGIYVPNAFTPNGDGVNDIFQPKGYGITKYELDVFDRWGEKIFQTNTFDHGWDGTVKGISIKNDVYTWRIKLTNVFGKSHELTGHVTLMK